ncbi:unnamed protein product, partial [Vitis vinifera]
MEDEDRDEEFFFLKFLRYLFPLSLGLFQVAKLWWQSQPLPVSLTSWSFESKSTGSKGTSSFFSFWLICVGSCLSQLLFICYTP